MKRLAALALAALALGPARAPARDLGQISFPVACAPAAQRPFVRGVLALHSFFYDQALDEFQAATRADPRCAMGYWGEAMAHDQTLWAIQDTPSGRAALARAAALAAGLPAREAAFIDAASVLFGREGERGERRARVRAYARALSRMHERWPDDDEIAALYALALLSANDQAHPSLRTRMEAGAIGLGVLQRNPQHPGAAHYVIHAFDDPDHAALALPAARAYAAIAPEAPHARHMPAHIFVELGRWQEAAAACESAWEVSLRWIAAHGRPRSHADFHSLAWLPPIYTQLGQLSRAEQALRTYGDTVARDGAGGTPGYIAAALALARDAGRWERLEALLAPAEAALPALDARWQKSGGPDTRPSAALTRALLAAARATAAARLGEVPRARRLLGEMRAQEALAARQAPGYYGEPERLEAEAAGLRVQAEIEAAQAHVAAAEAALRRAVPHEDTLAQTDGAQPAVMTSYERLGEVLLAAGRAADAGAALSAALERTPGRSRALLLAARAAERAGDREGAAERWRALAANWQRADPGLPDAAEARARARP